MVFPVVGGTQDTGDLITNSLRLNDGDTPSLSRSFGSSGNNKTFTFSCWFKFSDMKTGSSAADCCHGIFASEEDSGYQFFISTDENQILRIADYQSEYKLHLQTNRRFRDPSAWYHLVIIFDTTQGTASNRVKVYINGVQETSFSTETYPDQNQDLYGNENNTHYLGRRGGTNTMHMDGYLAEVHFVDGTAVAVGSFGETNDNGVWVPIEYTGSYGTNGFYLQFKETGTSANSSGMGADTSGNDNHFTPTNLAAIDVTTDTPQNNFCTMNPRYSYSGITFSEGNLQTNLGGSNHRWGTSTFFVANGKWYFECKLLSDSNYNSGPGVIAYGIDDPITTEGGGAGSKAEGWIYLSTNAGDLQHGGTQYGTASAATTNDILMVAFDVDNGKIWIGKNGSWNDGNPAAGTGAVREDLGDASSGLFSPGVSGYAENMVFNFGNPPFSISSGNADADGYGNFEYAPPSGFYALCTKNLAEYG